jgi:hypothetical protein
MKNYDNDPTKKIEPTKEPEVKQPPTKEQQADTIDEKLSTFEEQSSISLQTVEREVQEEKNQKQEPKEPTNEVYVGISKGVAFGKDGAGASGVSEQQKDVYSTAKAEVAGSFFKGGVLQTDMYAFMDMDGNPLKSAPYGQVHLSKQVYKGLNIEGLYEFTGTGKNPMKYGISYAGNLPNGGYKLKLLPLNHDGKPLGTSFDVSLSGSTKVGKN